MTLRASELDEVCRELEPLLSGLPVHKIVQPDDETVLLSLRGRWLLLCVSARAGRLHLALERGPGTGEAAPAFCMLLRKHLMGARLSSLRAVEGERACELSFVSAAGAPRLRLFLFGPAAQLQLIAPDDETILGTIGPARRRYESLPAPHPRAATIHPSRFKPVPVPVPETAMEAEPVIVTESVSRQPNPSAVSRQPSAVVRQPPAVVRQLSPSPPPSPSAATAPVSHAIAAHYATLDHSTSVDDARRQASTRLAAEARKLTRLIAALSSDLARADDAEALRKHADLLLVHFREIPRGASRISLPDDFTDGSPIEIALDPARSAKDNAERYYKEHKRLSRARGNMERRLAEATRRAEALALERARLIDASDSALLVDARTTPRAPSPREREAARSLPYKRYTSASGAAIFVGRGAAKNDALTWKVARGNDLWLHARDVSGAHVVIPLEGGRSADPETLVDAATLAAYHSNARGEAQVDIGYALRKHLRKPRGGAPGAVLVSQQKTLRVRLEPDRLARLLATAS